MAAGSSAGTESEGAVFTGSHFSKPSSTLRALSGPDWIDQPGLKRSGQVPRYRMASYLDSSPTIPPVISRTPTPRSPFTRSPRSV